MNSPLVSVIIPVYNAEQYLTRCLDSVLNQDYTNIEIILVDDGSTDNSGKICDHYASEDSRITVVHIPNGGASLARKRGLDLSHGEYVTFVDSDDWVSPYYVSTLLQLVSEYGVNVSSCGVQRVKHGEKLKDNYTEKYNSQLLSFEELMPRFFKYEFWGYPGKIYLRSCFERLDFPVATLSEDYYVMTQLFNKERQIASTDAPLYYYEFHDNSLSHQKLSKRAFEEFENVKAVYDYVCSNMSQYKKYAFSNVCETVVKLYFLKKQDTKGEYKEYFQTINKFLRQSRKDVIKNNLVPKGVKLLAFGLSISPSITFSIYYLLNGKA